MAPNRPPKVVTRPTRDKANPESKVKKAKSTLSVPALRLLKIKCPICFENIKTNAASSTRCGHVFCTQCLQKALRLMPACPSCRTSLRGSRRYHQLDLDIIDCDDGDADVEKPLALSDS